MSKYLIHKAVEVAKVHTKRRAVLTPEYLDRNYVAQPKYDGCNAIIILDVGAAPQILSRTGELVRSCDHIGYALSKALASEITLFNGIVLLGEIWHPFKDQSYTSGSFRRHSPDPSLTVKVFDALTLEEYNNGTSDREFLERFQFVEINVPSEYQANIYLCPQDYRNSRYDSWEDVRHHLQNERLDGYFDGLILRDPQGTWTQGSGTTGEIIKLKPHKTWDLRVTGVEEGEGKHAGRLGAIVVDYKGKELRVGSGFSNEARGRWFKHPRQIIGQIVEIAALDESSKGLLREPRFKGIRHDKEEPDT